MANLSNINNKFIVTDGGQALVNQTAPGFNPDADDLIVGNLSGNTGITIASGSSAGNYGSIYFADGAGSSTPSKAGFIRYEQNTSEMTIGINAEEKIAIALNGDTTFSGTVKTKNTSANAYPYFSIEASAKEYHIGVGGASAVAGYANNLYFYDNTDAAIRMLIDTNGNVGIGEDSPDATLHIKHNSDISSDFLIIEDSDSTAGSVVPKIQFRSTSSAIGGIRGHDVRGLQLGGGANIQDLTINPSGDVGIGTTSPGSRLTVNKTKSGTGIENYDLIRLGLLGTGAVGDSSTICWFSTSGTKTAGIEGISGLDNILYGELAFHVRKYTTDSYDEVMRINNRGIVQINTNVAKTSTSTVEFGSFGQSNEATNYSTLQMYTKGGASQADRKVVFQTIEAGVANAGSIILQPSGGNVGIGDISAPNKLSVKDTAGNLVCRFTASSGAFSLYQNNTDGTVIFSANHGNTGSENRFIWQNAGAVERMRLYSDGRLHPQGGIFLGSSNNSNLLNYYASGTWTPTVTTSQLTSPTITSSSGRWQRVGKVVTASFEFTMSNPTVGAGTVIINNLPIVFADNNHVSGCGVIGDLGKTINVRYYTGSNQIGMNFYDGNYCGTAYRTVGTVTYWAAT